MAAMKSFSLSTLLTASSPWVPSRRSVKCRKSPRRWPGTLWMSLLVGEFIRLPPVALSMVQPRRPRVRLVLGGVVLRVPGRRRGRVHGLPSHPLQIEDEDGVEDGYQQQRDERRHGEAADLRVAERLPERS